MSRNPSAFAQLGLAISSPETDLRSPIIWIKEIFFLPPNTVGGSLNEQSLKLSKATGGIRQCVKVQCVRMDINTKPKAQKNLHGLLLSSLGYPLWDEADEIPLNIL